MNSVWWYFVKQYEDETTVTYAYSRESRSLDGEISISKKTGFASMVKPCFSDNENTFAIDKVLSKVFYLVKDGFPDKRQIACG